MNLFLLNLILALVWGAVTGSFAPANLLFGFALGFTALWMVRDRFAINDVKRPARIARLAWLFIYELVLSSIKVARDTLSPRMEFRPAIIAIPLDVEEDIGIMLLANLISLTPGTLSVDISQDRTTLYLHAMDVDDPDDLRRDIKQGFERRIMEALG